MLKIAMPLLLHDEFDARETQPGELRLGIDPERNCIDLALVDQDGAGMAAELSAAEAIELVLKLVGSIARLRRWEELP